MRILNAVCRLTYLLLSKPVAADRIGKIDASKLGYWLRSSKDRIVDGWKFSIVAAPHGVTEWAVVKG
jgi:hypothetical protein